MKIKIQAGRHVGNAMNSMTSLLYAIWKSTHDRQVQKPYAHVAADDQFSG
jgi:hypothetical protein